MNELQGTPARSKASGSQRYRFCSRAYRQCDLAFCYQVQAHIMPIIFQQYMSAFFARDVWLSPKGVIVACKLTEQSRELGWCEQCEPGSHGSSCGRLQGLELDDALQLAN